MSAVRLVVVTDRTQVPPGRSLPEVLVAAADAGLRAVLLREVDLPGDERNEIADHARTAGLTVIAAHRPVTRCAGLHCPATAPRPAFGQRWGRSCHSRGDLVRAAAQGAAWATLSPYTSTASKPGYGPPAPTAAWRAPPLPVYALGGITVDNAAAVISAGAHGVAVMGAVMRAQDPADVVARLLEVTR
ncbi:MAG: thiamine phosphate synthase [Nocardioidaceae bacterium]|nr:thiamine phosphate synthase [Nocardioidaceae bacterium]